MTIVIFFNFLSMKLARPHPLDCELGLTRGTLSHPRGGLRRRGDPRLISVYLFFCVKGSRHLVLWSLGTLTGLSEILRQGTGCVKGRY
jgi:hypothetical protein